MKVLTLLLFFKFLNFFENFEYKIKNEAGVKEGKTLS